MRQKVTLRRRAIGRDRREADVDQAASAESPAKWLLANEAGWGVPHGLSGILAALLAGYLVVGIRRWIVSRLRDRRS